MNSQEASGAPWPLMVGLIAAILLSAVIGHVFLRMPVAFNDNFEEIVATYQYSLGTLIAHEFAHPGVYFRPLEMACRYLISHGFNQGIFGYNLFAAIWLILVTTTFTLVCRPRTSRDLTAFLVALAVLIGHHATHAAWEFNIVISNGVVLLAVIVAIGLIARPATIAGQICAVLLTFISLLIKEVGLIVPGVFVLAYLLAMPGIRRTAAIIIALLTLAYLGFHLYTLPSLAQHDANKARSVSGYLSNAIATIVIFWIGLPWDGVWSKAGRFLSEPWQWVQIGSGIATLVLLICGWFLAPTTTECENDRAPILDRRWFVILGAALLASAGLGFYYTRHRHGAPAVPLLAYCTYLSMRVLLWRLDRIGKSQAFPPARSLVWMTIAGLACTLLWPIRDVTGFEFLRALSGHIKTSWHDTMATRWSEADANRRPFLVPFAESVDEFPWPRRRVPILKDLGYVLKSVNM